jgi:hypothetical protein
MIAAAFLLAAGCQPPPEKEDEIGRTMRMIEEAKRGPQPGTPVGNNVYIRVERLTAAEREAAGLAALWKYANGRVTVSGRDGLGGGGVRLAAAGPEFEAQANAWSRGARSASRTTEEIMVMSGAEGHLWIGRSVMVPVLNIVTESGRTVVLERARVGAALRVRPRTLDDGRIELELQPEFSALEGPEAGRTYAVTALTSRVTVAPGQRLVLGGSQSMREGSAAAGLFGFSSAGDRASTIVTVRAERF